MPLRTQTQISDPARTTPVGILFADIAGSTRLYERLGDTIAHVAVADCLEVMAEGIASEGGTLVKTIGDAVMGAFADAPATIRAALAIRRLVGEMQPIRDAGGHSHRLRVRTGLHFGPALADGGDWFGDTVNVAARLSDLASAGQILAAAEILPLLPPDLAELAEIFAEIEVKGREAPVRVARVTEPEAVQESTIVGLALRTAVPPPPETPVTLAMAGRSWTLPPGMRRIVLGREADCDVALKGSRASRRHATLERRGGRLVLVDHSSNGTWVVQGDDPPVRLSREELRLAQDGTISFGSLDDPDADRLDFRLG